MFGDDGIMVSLAQASPVQRERSFQLLTLKPRTSGSMVTLARSKSSWMTSIKEECASVIILRSGRTVTRVAGRLREVRYH